MENGPIKVLIVDDSALMRSVLTEILSADPEIEVVGVAADPLIARTKIKQLNPDVVTLDVEMPRMDGLEFLRKIMTLRPMPVVMISSLTQKNADITLEALEIGAVDFVSKPDFDMRHSLDNIRGEIVEKVKLAFNARGRLKTPTGTRVQAVSSRTIAASRKVVVIGASTGGVEALKEVLTALPPSTPPVTIVQHMPERFTASFATRLNSLCAMTVKEVTKDQPLTKGHVYIAPGNKHLKVFRSGAEFRCALDDGPPVSGHKPSVDVLFHSAAEHLGKNAIGVILTGMGKDGAQGMLALKNAGANTLGQDEKTSLVYGMPRAAFELGGIEQQKPLSQIADAIIDLCDT